MKCRQLQQPHSMSIYTASKIWPQTTLLTSFNFICEALQQKMSFKGSKFHCCCFCCFCWSKPIPLYQKEQKTSRADLTSKAFKQKNLTLVYVVEKVVKSIVVFVVLKKQLQELVWQFLLPLTYAAEFVYKSSKKCTKIQRKLICLKTT